MQEKNPQEKAAAEKQAELLINAMERAKENGGVWLNPSEKTAPRFYPRGVNVSAFNAMTMALHSDQNNYKTNEYTLFSEAKKRGESVQSRKRVFPSTGTTGRNMSTGIILKMSSAVKTTRLWTKSNKQNTRESEPVKSVLCSISTRQPFLSLTRNAMSRKSRHMEPLRIVSTPNLRVTTSVFQSMTSS